jgi:DNA-binding CsgD family transcriptional regulator
MRPDPQRLRRDLVAVCHQGLDVPGFFGRARQVLGRYVGFDGCCCLTFDPATILPTGHIPYRSIPPEQVPRAVENEYAEEDVNKFAVLARELRHVGVLSQATGGRRDRSIRYQVVLVPNGFENELRVAFVQDGSCWGGVAMYRSPSRPDFTPVEAAAAAAAGGLLAEGVRRAILTTAIARQETVDAPGLVLLDAANRVDAVTPAARHWLAELLFDEELPSIVHAMANHARRAGRPDTPGPLQPAQARARTRSGRWLILHGSLVDGDPDGRVAVIMEPARPPQIAPLVAMAYGLSPRERDIARLVLQGLSTSEIATELFLSPHTVQDYLKAIFDKVGVRSRREMVTRVFTEYYAPRLADQVPVGADGWFLR